MAPVKKIKMKAGQIYHVETIRSGLALAFRRQSIFVRKTRRFEMREERPGHWSRGNASDAGKENQEDNGLGIPVPIAHRVRSRSRSRCLLSLTGDTDLAPSTLDKSMIMSPMPGPRVHRRTTIEVVRDDPAIDEEEVSVYGDDVVDEEERKHGKSNSSDDSDFGEDNVFCTTPLKKWPTRCLSAGSHRSSLRNSLSGPQIEEVWSRRVGPGVKQRSPEKSTGKKGFLSRKRVQRTLSSDVTPDQSSRRAAAVAGAAGLKRRLSSAASVGTPVGDTTLTSSSLFSGVDSTYGARNASSALVGARRRKRPLPIAQRIARPRKRLRLHHDLTVQNLNKLSDIKRKLFNNISVIEAAGRRCF